MECVPWLSVVVLHCALRVLPTPARATAAQPASELPPSVKLTLPVGPNPVTVAVKVTFAPATDGLAELDSAVVLVALLTTCDKVVLVEPLLVASPLYTALMLCVATLRLLVAQVAVRILPVPASATAAQPAIDVAPSLKLTVPVGLAPVTVAVKVTFAPTVDGLVELLSVVVVAVPPAVVTLTVSALALAPSTMMLTP